MCIYLNVHDAHNIQDKRLVSIKAHINAFCYKFVYSQIFMYESIFMFTVDGSAIASYLCGQINSLFRDT